MTLLSVSKKTRSPILATRSSWLPGRMVPPAVAAPAPKPRSIGQGPGAAAPAAVDRELDENAYIRPGLGDAGDRLFGTR